MEKYTQKLATFCSELTYEKIPQKVVEQTKQAIIDNFGIALGATLTDFGEKISRYAKEIGDREEATIFGFGLKSSTRNAAFVNGSLSETLEMQDGYTKGGNHPSCGTIPASLAIVEWKKKTGKDLITSILAGYEVGNRVSESIFPSHLSKGFQPTGTAGTVGAAAAASKALGLNSTEISNALGNSAFILPVSIGDNLWGGYSIKPVHGGAAARAGIDAALLAQLGLTGAPLEGDPKINKGFCKVLSEKPDFEKMVEGLGQQYTIEDIYFKPYACCRVNHSAVEITIELSKKHRINKDDVKEILIKTYDFAASVPGTIRTSPKSSQTLCQFSMPYVTAVALIDKEVGLRQFTNEKIADPSIHDLASKVNVVSDEEMEKMRPANRPASVEITVKDGSKVSGRVDYPKGDPRKPMTDEELKNKYLNLALSVIGKERAAKLLETLMNLENQDSLDEICELLK